MKTKTIIREIKIKYYEYKVKKLLKIIQNCEYRLMSQSTMMADIPKYKKMKKEAEYSANGIYDKLYRLRKESIMDHVDFFKRSATNPVKFK